MGVVDFGLLFDPVSGGIVVGGTLLATAARAGVRNCATTLTRFGRLFANHFDPSGLRAQLALQIEEVRWSGVIRAEQVPISDREFSQVVDALVRHRSFDAAEAVFAQLQAQRRADAEAAAATLAIAGELAPVLGLAGTLLSLSQLSLGSSGSVEEIMGSVSMAVLTTLYGLLFGNLVLFPLSATIERVAAREDSERRELMDWLAAQIRALGKLPEAHLQRVA